jgi:pimeloyl-ACP methyl ester carboxylesterase
MAIPPTNASSEREDATRTNTTRVKMAWFEHGTSRIFYETQGSGTPVLLLPGFSQGNEEFSYLREALVGAGYRIIAADLPGSGRSEPQPRTYTATYYEDDAQSFVALLRHLATESAHLIGFSDGAEVSLLMATLIPEGVRSVVVWGGAGVINDPDGRLREAMYNIVDHPIPPLKPLQDFLITTYGEANARTMTQSHVTALSDIIKGGGELSRSKADRITCPVLLISGEHDMFAAPALAAKLAARIPTAETLIAEGAEHNVYGERPEWLTQTILDWVEKH